MRSSRRDLMDQGRGVNDGSWPDAGVRRPLSAKSGLYSSTTLRRSSTDLVLMSKEVRSCRR